MVCRPGEDARADVLGGMFRLRHRDGGTVGCRWDRSVDAVQAGASLVRLRMGLEREGKEMKCDEKEEEGLGEAESVVRAKCRRGPSICCLSRPNPTKLCGVGQPPFICSAQAPHGTSSTSSTSLCSQLRTSIAASRAPMACLECLTTPARRQDASDAANPQAHYTHTVRYTPWPASTPSGAPRRECIKRAARSPTCIHHPIANPLSARPPRLHITPARASSSTAHIHSSVPQEPQQQKPPHTRAYSSGAQGPAPRILPPARSTAPRLV